MTEATAFPLSFSQKRLWLVDRMDPGGPQYAMPLAITVTGPLNDNLLQQALDFIVDRHEILRTTFTLMGDEAVQLIKDEGSLPLQHQDFSDMSDAQAQADKRMQALASEPFDLEKGPLIRAHLFKLAADKATIFVNMHHIISDGWSLAVFFKELIHVYTALKNGTPPNLPELEVQYADFTEWQQEWFEDGGMDNQLQWWKENLNKAPFLLPLNTDYSRPPTQSFEGTSALNQLEQGTFARAESLARELRTTPFIVLLASYAVLLARYTGQKDILIGTPIANRNRGEVEPLIGFFVNTLPLRAQLNGNPSFETLVKRLHDNAMNVYANQDIPFEKLVEELNPERDLSHSPIFQVLFTLESGDLNGVDADDLSYEPHTIDNGTCKFDLGLSLSRSESGLAANLRYNTNLFETGTAERFLEHYKTLTEALFKQPEGCIWNHSPLPESETHHLCHVLNKTEQDISGPLVHQIFESHALANPTETALVDKDRSLTYDETNRLANRLARHLINLGVRDEEAVAICMDPCVDMFVGKLAILKAGAAYLPMDPKYPAERLNYMLRDIGDPILLTRTNLLEMMPENTRPTIALDDPNLDLSTDDSDLGRRIETDQLAYAIYTSGSTGQPKGVSLSHRGLSSLVAWHLRTFEVTPADRSAQFAGPAFDAAVWSMWPYLAGGASIYIPDDILRVSAFDVPQWLADKGITICFLPTPLAEAMLHVDEPEGLKVRILLTGGDKLTQKPTEQTSFQLINNYGPTEGTVVTTSWPIDAEEVMPPPIGTPVDNNRTYVLDKWGMLAPTGVPGELFVGGETLARGYHKRPALTAERFLPDPFSTKPGARMYRTGDLVKIENRQCLLFLGRTDFQVKLRGFRIELGEIEASLLEREEIHEAIVSLREDRPGDKRLVAYVVNEGDLDRNGITEYLKQQMPDYMVPSAIVALEAMPLTANGKIDKSALPQPSDDAASKSDTYIAASSETEQTLVEIWQEVLNLEQIGTADNFFDLGGHSMLMTKVQRRIKEKLSQDLGMVVLFRHPTIAALANWMDGERQETKAADTGRSRAQKQKEARMKRKGMKTRKTKHGR